MRKINHFHLPAHRIYSFFFFFFFFVFLRPTPVKAYETVSCAIRHRNAFDFSQDNSEFAILKNQVGPLYFYFLGLDDYYHYPESVFRGWVYQNGTWTEEILESGPEEFVIYKTVGFSEVKNYRLAAYLYNTANGKGYYCSGEAWVYDTEGVVTSGGWIGSVLRATSPDIYLGPAVKSPSGKKIAGIRYTVSDFAYNECTTCFHDFFPRVFGAVGNGSFTVPYVFKKGEQEEAKFQLAPNLGVYCSIPAGCWVEARIPSIGDIILYTRGPVAPATPPPPLPSTAVYGYVKDKTTGGGIPGAKITVHRYLGASHTQISVTTSSDGRWSVDFSDIGIDQLRIFESNALGCTQDDGKADIPCPPPPNCAPIFPVVDKNEVWWNDPSFSAGPITFWDQGCTLPTLTPTPTPTPSVCPLGSRQEGGVAQLSLKNNWQSVTFSSLFSGYIDKISIKAGNYGGAQRSITCKITNSQGTTNITGELSSAPFTSVSKGDWRNMAIPSPYPTLTAGTTYRLYCKGPDTWNSLYWIYNNEPLKGKTYRVYQCSANK